MLDTKKCRDCGRNKPVSEFPTYKRNKDGLFSYCKPCKSKRSARYQDPLKKRNNQLKSRYGITLEDYDALLAAQDGKCAICGATEPGGHSNQLLVDHCHKTGKVRGLLCDGCNRGIGYFQEDAARIIAAREYVQSHTGE